MWSIQIVLEEAKESFYSENCRIVPFLANSHVFLYNIYIYILYNECVYVDFLMIKVKKKI